MHQTCAKYHSLEKKQLAYLLLFLSINVVGAKLFNKYKKHIQICMHFDFQFAFVDLEIKHFFRSDA